MPVPVDKVSAVEDLLVALLQRHNWLTFQVYRLLRILYWIEKLQVIFCCFLALEEGVDL